MCRAVSGTVSSWNASVGVNRTGTGPDERAQMAGGLGQCGCCALVVGSGVDGLTHHGVEQRRVVQITRHRASVIVTMRQPSGP